MSTTWTMWLGIAFVALAVVAVLLQAWLWSYPMEPPGDPKGRSTAPRGWVALHRLTGLAYLVIYVVMMAEMLPRLWEYQFELPARTVVHAVAAIVIGVLLLTKIAIIRFFQHFGKALPAIGLGIFTCTIILATLSLPFALRAHDLGGRILSPENLSRTRSALEGTQAVASTTPEALTSPASLRAGRAVLMRQCTACHDLRTALQKPRSAEGWHALVARMAAKPTIGAPIEAPDIPKVTAYLVAITPDLQRSQKERRAEQISRSQDAAKVVEALAAPPSEEGGGAAAAPPAAPAPAEGEALLKELCTDCHELDEIDARGGDTRSGWEGVLQRMVEENGAELTAEQARALADYLAASRPPG